MPRVTRTQGAGAAAAPSVPERRAMEKAAVVLRNALGDKRITKSEAESIRTALRAPAQTLLGSTTVKLDASARKTLQGFLKNASLPGERTGDGFFKSPSALIGTMTRTYNRALTDRRLSGAEAGEIVSAIYEAVRSMAMNPKVKRDPGAQQILRSLLPGGDIPITTFYGVGEESGGPVGPGGPTVTTEYAVGEESGGPVGPGGGPGVTTFYAVGEESGGPVNPGGPGVTTFYAVGEESGGAVPSGGASDPYPPGTRYGLVKRANLR